MVCAALNNCSAQPGVSDYLATVQRSMQNTAELWRIHTINHCSAGSFRVLNHALIMTAINAWLASSQYHKKIKQSPFSLLIL